MACHRFVAVVGARELPDGWAPQVLASMVHEQQHGARVVPLERAQRGEHGSDIGGHILVDRTHNIITRNTFDDNAEDGIFVGSDGGTIDGNRGRNNGNDGLDVQGFDNVVSNNTFFNNGNWDICVIGGNTGGGGNRGGVIIFDC